MTSTISFHKGTMTERHTVSGVAPKSVAEMIALTTGQDAVWTGKVRAEWHITDKRTRKVTAVIH
jgi:hypothetical protein